MIANRNKNWKTCQLDQLKRDQTWIKTMPVFWNSIVTKMKQNVLNEFINSF